MGNYRLFDKLDIKPLLLHLIEDPDCFLRLPCLVCIDSQLSPASDRIPDRGKALNIKLRVHSYLYLKCVVTAVYGGNGITGHLLRAVHADRDISDD